MAQATTLTDDDVDAIKAKLLAGVYLDVLVKEYHTSDGHLKRRLTQHWPRFPSWWTQYGKWRRYTQAKKPSTPPAPKPKPPSPTMTPARGAFVRGERPRSILDADQATLRVRGWNEMTTPERQAIEQRLWARLSRVTPETRQASKAQRAIGFLLYTTSGDL
jgi:hypothetical protein